MYQRGHIGASLLVYAPFGFVLSALTSVELAFIGAAAVGSMAMVPDIDMKIPLVKHRGITHTIWFALVVGAVFGLVGAIFGIQESILSGVLFGLLAFGFGTLTIISHLLADAVSPMGVEPFAPLRDDNYTLDLFKAANPIANYAMLGLGGIVVAAAVGGVWSRNAASTGGALGGLAGATLAELKSGAGGVFADREDDADADGDEDAEADAAA